MTGWYHFSNVKPSKMLSFYSVAEAHGLIYPRPSGENFSFALLSSHSSVGRKCGRVTTMTCSTCTCHKIPKFVVFLPNFILLQKHLSKEAGGKAIIFVLSSSSSENLISERLSICNHVRRSVSRDRPILFIKM